MKEITSTSNNIIKDAVKLHQKKYRESYILIEGKKALDEAISANLQIKYIFCKNKTNYSNFETYFVTDEILKKISTTDSPANVVAVVEKPKYNINEFKKMKKIVLLENVKDPGNLGTIIRACSAFGAEGVMLAGECVDEFSPKTIRSTAGNMFKIPVLKVDFKALSEFKGKYKFIATVCHSNNSFENITQKDNVIIMFGSEADGLSKEMLNFADEFLTIKLAHNVESLNLAMSAVVVLYEMQKK